MHFALGTNTIGAGDIWFLLLIPLLAFNLETCVFCTQWLKLASQYCCTLGSFSQLLTFAMEIISKGNFQETCNVSKNFLTAEFHFVLEIFAVSAHLKISSEWTLPTIRYRNSLPNESSPGEDWRLHLLNVDDKGRDSLQCTIAGNSPIFWSKKPNGSMLFSYKYTVVAGQKENWKASIEDESCFGFP